ncbi:hypothetical protein ACHAPU_011541 [Fusarium lateritium]
MSLKLIVVLGANGNQGGSVANVYFNEPGYKVRVVTRNPSSAKAQMLATRGAEVIQADLDSPATLQAAFKDANIIFMTSDFWSIYNHADSKNKAKPGQSLNAWTGEQETQQLKNAIDAAAKTPTLERFILSSIPHITKLSKGKYTHVYHFDSKARAEDYGRAVYPELWAKTSILYAGYFLSNHTRKDEFEDNLAYLNEFGYDYGDEPAMIHPRELDPAPVFDTVEDYFRKHDWTNVISS